MRLLALMMTTGLGTFFWSSPANASCAPQTPLHLWPHEWRDLEIAVHKVLPPNTEIDTDASRVCNGGLRHNAHFETRHAPMSDDQTSWWEVTCRGLFGRWGCSSVHRAYMRVPLEHARVDMILEISDSTPLMTATDLARRAARVLVDPQITPMHCHSTAVPDQREWKNVRERVLNAPDLRPVVSAKENVATVDFAHTAGLAVQFRMDASGPVAECWYETVEVVTLE
jgi:hypothetical protein